MVTIPHGLPMVLGAAVGCCDCANHGLVEQTQNTVIEMLLVGHMMASSGSPKLCNSATPVLL